MFGNESGLRAIVIPVARVDNVSAATSSLLVSPPTPLAALGLMRKMEIDLQQVGILPRGRHPFECVSLIVHEFEISPGHRRIPPEMRGEENKKAGAMLDDPEGHLLCTLVISARMAADDLNAIKAHLARNIRGYRLGGGRIVRAGIASPDVGKDSKPGINPVEVAADEEQFQRILRALPSGSVLADRTYMLAENPEDPDGGDALDRLLDVVVRKKVTSGEGKQATTSWRRKHAGWLVPVAIGWRAISDVRMRKGMREAEGVVGHAWAEDVLGLGEWVSIRKAFKDGDGNRGTGGFAWAYGEAPAEGPYLAVGGEFF